MPDKPANYGVWWNTNNLDEAWYRQIFEPRRAVHMAFLRWVKEIEAREGMFSSVLEVGCGRGVVYPDAFAGDGKLYTGYDVSAKEIEWCKKHRALPGHEYLSGDFIVDQDVGKHDLVFAHAVVDHVYDADAFLTRVVQASLRWVYVTAYKSWSPQLKEHVYVWDPTSTCFYNDLAPERVRELLVKLGCRDIRVEPFWTGNKPCPQETLIVARVP
jgi:SAM-dependent methyltransferase